MSVRLYVTPVVIVDNGQSIKVFVFLHNVEHVCMDLWILNLEGHKNCMIDSKVTTILTTFFVNDY